MDITLSRSCRLIGVNLIKIISLLLAVSIIAFALVSLSPIDGLHLDEEGHKKLAIAVARAIQDIFEKADC